MTIANEGWPVANVPTGRDIMGATLPGTASSGAENKSRGRSARELCEERSHLCDQRLLIVDDCTLHRDNLVSVFVACGCSSPKVAWDLTSLVTELTETPPDLVLINVDTRDSVILLQGIFDVAPNMKVIVLGLSEDDEDRIVACAEAGVVGYHVRTDSLDDLVFLIRRVAAGETSFSPRVSAVLLRRLSALANQRRPAANGLVLTAREAEILRMLEMGLSNRDIAEQLCIAVHTVKNHVHSLLTKLGVGSRNEAAALYRTVGFTQLNPEN